MKLKLTSLAIALSALSGCSTIVPAEHKEDSAITEQKAIAAAEATDAWNKQALLTEGKASVVLMTPQSIPDAVKARKVTMELEPATSIQDLVAILGNLGITTIIADEAASKKVFYLPRFNGNLGNLLSSVTRATDVWFAWQDGAVVVSSTERIGVSVPQEAAFAKQLTEGLTSLGIKASSVNWQAGMATMDVSPSEFRRVRTFLERYTANSAVVTLQMAVVNVVLNQSVKEGIDWDQLQISATTGGSAAELLNANKVLNPSSATSGTTTSTGSTGSTGSTTAGSAAASDNTTLTLKQAVSGAGWAGGALTGAVFTNRFSFQGLFNYLSKLGVAETKHNVLLRTVTGNKVEFKSLLQIPYISEVGATSTSSTSTGTSKSDKADDGITVEMTPAYDAAANSVTVDLKLAIKSVVAFNELSAGNQLGKLTMPTTAERSFTDSLRIRPGQTLVVGGLTYDNVSDNKGAPVFLTGTKLESQSMTVTRQSMFIVLRPSVVRLGQVLATETGDSLEFTPAGDYTPEPAAPAPGRKKKVVQE